MVKKIKVLCAEHDTTIAVLEKALGFAHGSIYKWDAHSPAFEKVVAVADFFGITADELKKEDRQCQKKESFTE